MNKLIFLMISLILLTGCTTMFLRPNVSSPVLTKPGEIVVSQNVSRYGQNRSIAYSPINNVGVICNEELMKKYDMWSGFDNIYYDKVKQKEIEMGLGFYYKYHKFYGALTYLYADGDIENQHSITNEGRIPFHFIADYKKDAVIGSLYYDELVSPKSLPLNTYIQVQAFVKYSELKFTNIQIIKDTTPSNLKFLKKKNRLVEIGYNYKFGLKHYKLCIQYSMGFSSSDVPIHNYSIGAELTGDIYSIFKK